MKRRYFIRHAGTTYEIGATAYAAHRGRGDRVEAKVGPAELAQRQAACAGCDWTASKGRACEHPERNCRRLNPSLASERCPLGRWGASV